MNALNSFELGLLHSLHDAVGCRFLDIFLSCITHLGDAGLFWFALAVVLILIPKTRKVGLHMGIALIFGTLVCNVTLKPLVARIRPYDADPSIVLLVKAPHDYSFPSGHTAASFEGAVSIWMHDKKSGAAALVLASLIAFSRLYLMVHYPTDVLGGLVIGIMSAILASAVTEWIWRKYAEKNKEALS